MGNYRLVKRIGGGGFGDVYRAEHVELGNPFAIKVLHKHLAADPSFVERFRTEAMVLAGLQHENVVNVVDFGQHDDLGFYLVMEWLEGRTLHRVWRRKRVFPLSQIYALFSQLLDALDKAHRLGVVHRDMKPENLILTKGSRNRAVLKIVDFGIATMVRGSGEKSGGAIEGAIVGTPYYMSPEQARGRHQEVDGRADIYACGVILFELLTGRRLFATKDPREVLRHQIQTPPPRLESIPGKTMYSPLLQAVLDRALAKDLAQRYASAAEMFGDLQIAMQTEGVEPDEEGIDASQLRGAASQTSLLALAMGSEEAAENAVDNRESLSTGAGYRGQKATFGGASSDVLEPPSEESTPGPSPVLWVLAGSVIGIAVLVLLLVGLQSWQPSPPPSSRSLALPPVVRPPQLPRRSNDQTPPRDNPTGDNPTGATAKASSSSQGTSRERPHPPALRAPKPSPRQRRKARRRRQRLRRRQRQRRLRRQRLRRQRRLRRRRLRQRRRRVALRRVRTRRLSIATLPPQAKVFVNGKLRGTTPLKLQLPEGRPYVVEIKKKGFVTQKFRWQARRNLSKRAKLIEDLF